MVAIGKRNTLRILHNAPPGFYLDGGELGQILLPGRYIPSGAVPGDEIDVFIHRDSEDRLLATTETPLAAVGEFAALRVAHIHRQMGAFLDWGLSKDLLLPIREQTRRVAPGERVVAYVHIDPRTQRIVATTRLNAHLDLTPPPYTEGQRVRLLIADETPLGFKAIVENAHWGLLYRTDLSAPLAIGQQLDGFVRLIRPGGKIDLALDLTGYKRVVPLALRILEAIKADGGKLDFDDASSPEEIRARFDVSKKAFKQALGALFRAQRIHFENPGIRLADDAPPGMATTKDTKNTKGEAGR